MTQECVPKKKRVIDPRFSSNNRVTPSLSFLVLFCLEGVTPSSPFSFLSTRLLSGCLDETCEREKEREDSWFPVLISSSPPPLFFLSYLDVAEMEKRLTCGTMSERLDGVSFFCVSRLTAREYFFVTVHTLKENVGRSVDVKKEIFSLVADY